MGVWVVVVVMGVLWLVARVSISAVPASLLDLLLGEQLAGHRTSHVYTTQASSRERERGEPPSLQPPVLHHNPTTLHTNT